MSSTVSIIVIVFAFMLVEARRAAVNERAQRARGGLEPPGDVYGLMQIAYPVSFLAMIAEGAWRGGAPVSLLAAGAVVFAAAKSLKWWAILSLGPFWTFRVIVIPGSTRIVTGPYRFVPHPNYVAVVGEFVGIALMAGARVSGPAALLVFAALLVKRIAVEERTLRTSTR